jgi:hypothetical protein
VSVFRVSRDRQLSLPPPNDEEFAAGTDPSNDDTDCDGTDADPLDPNA